MNSEMNTTTNGPKVMTNLSTVIIDSETVQVMRRCLHDLANVFTGVMIGGGLLSQRLEGGPLARYASDICEGSERGSVLVQQLRSQLMAALGEMEVVGNGNSADKTQGQ